MRFLVVLLLSGLACFAADARTTIADKWYAGDGLGYNIYLELLPTGTYEASWRGCLGEYGAARGKWREAAGEIALTPSEEKGMMKGHLTTLFILTAKGETKLLRKEDARYRDNPFCGFRRQKNETKEPKPSSAPTHPAGD